MKLAIYGAGGILGQTMRLYQERGIETRYYRTKPDPAHHGIDLTKEYPGEFDPNVIVNLAGENRPDIVEAQPSVRYRKINVFAPEKLARWCDQLGAHYIHVSTQGVFDGMEPPYSPGSEVRAVNRYGEQKIEAEERISKCANWTIVRPTFVLGVRPFPHVGRQNPIEQMLENPRSAQVNDHWFSPLFARAAAKALWQIILNPPKHKIVHLGTPERVSRYSIAQRLGPDYKPVPHNYFHGFAQRPLDTTYSKDCLAQQNIAEGLSQCRIDHSRIAGFERAREIAMFLGISEAESLVKLGKGFPLLHQEVGADFRRANPQNDDDLLRWYRETESYVWELSAYHLDPGFNYAGMCQGIIDRLKGESGDMLCLGDGIGDLTLALRRVGVNAIYHDLQNSKTAQFARFQIWKNTGKIPEVSMTDGWQPEFNGRKFKSVLCLDFLEHMTDVALWVRAIKDLLHPGGVALFQNAFNMGSGPNGSIPMHLARNDRYEKEWTPLMQKIGFKQQGTSNWWEV